MRVEKILNATPMGRFGKAEKLVGMLLWLLNNKMSRFINGVYLLFDGSFSAHSVVCDFAG